MAIKLHWHAQKRRGGSTRIELTQLHAHVDCQNRRFSQPLNSASRRAGCMP